MGSPLQFPPSLPENVWFYTVTHVEAFEDIGNEEQALAGLEYVGQATWVLSKQLLETKDILRLI